MERNTVYDLGEIGETPKGPITPQPQAAPSLATGLPDAFRIPPKQLPRPAVLRRPRPQSNPSRASPVFLPSIVGMVVPGGGHLVLGRIRAGVIWLGAALLLCGVMAVGLSILPRLWKAVGVMGWRPETTVWALGASAGLLAVVQVSSALSMRAQPPADRRLHPAFPCCASTIVPGWGQLLNGDAVRAALFLVAVWVTGAAWLMASAPFEEFLAAYQLELPRFLSLLAAAPTRWALPAAFWPLAIHDAGTSACMARR